MIDHAEFNIESGCKIASKRIQDINDNMPQYHYHEYFELYYPESSKRYPMIGNQIYHMNTGEFVLIPPYIMHHSYGENDIPFKRQNPVCQNNRRGTFLIRKDFYVYVFPYSVVNDMLPPLTEAGT